MSFDLLHKDWLRLQQLDRIRISNTVPHAITYPEDTSDRVIRFGPVLRWSHQAMLLRQLTADAGVKLSEVSALPESPV